MQLERPPEAEIGLQTEVWGEDGFPTAVVFQSPAVADMSTQVFEDEVSVTLCGHASTGWSACIDSRLVLLTFG